MHWYLKFELLQWYDAFHVILLKVICLIDRVQIASWKNNRRKILPFSNWKPKELLSLRIFRNKPSHMNLAIRKHFLLVAYFFCVWPSTFFGKPPTLRTHNKFFAMQWKRKTTLVTDMDTIDFIIKWPASSKVQNIK